MTMGRISNQFISLEEAAQLLGRTPSEVLSLCDEGLMRRKSDGTNISIHKDDAKEVAETNLNDLARPRDLVQKVLLLERRVRGLCKTMDLYGRINGMLSSSLELTEQELVGAYMSTIEALREIRWTLDEMSRFSKLFLRISEIDILAINESIGAHDSWRAFYELCLRMNWHMRDAHFPPGRDTDSVHTMLRKGLKNLRSIGILFIENAAFFQSSAEMLQRTASHDLAEFDILLRRRKSNNDKKTLT